METRMHRLLIGFTTWLALAALLLSPLPASAQTPEWQPGPGAVLENTYVGFIDVPSGGATVSTGGFTVSGWVVDRAAQGWAGIDDVQVWLGAMDGGGRMLARALFAQSRPDVGSALGNPFWAASGFVASIPSGAVPAGSQTLSVYAHTPGKGWWFRQVQVNASASAPPPAAAPAPGQVSGAALPVVAIEEPESGERVGTRDEFEIIGYALDPNAARNQGVQSTGIDRVEVYINGERDAGGVFLGQAEQAFSSTAAESRYGSQFASAGWRLRFKPTQFKAEGHELYVYARSVVSGKETLETRGFETFEN
jgi:hypothetical protein